METAKVYADSILAVAEKWVSEGAKRLHLVDLNGAFAGEPVHFNDVAAVAKKFPHVEIEVGGGIRSLDTVKRYLGAGVDFCILGTAAIRNPRLVIQASRDFPEKIILSLDARGGFVATDGWDKKSKIRAYELVEEFGGLAIESLIYTDVAKDGMLGGMNFSEIELMKGCGFQLIASGGLASLDDIDRLVKMDIYGVIAGKALYERRFSLSEAMQHAQKTNHSLSGR